MSTPLTQPVTDPTVSCIHTPGREMDVNTTWSQIGQWTLAHVGARNLAYSKEYVQFDTSGKRRRILVKLTAADLYTVEVGRLVKIDGLKEYRALRSVEMIDADQLRVAVRAAFEES